MTSAEIIKIVITAIITAAVTGAITYVLTVRSKVRAASNGILSCLRADIIAYYDKYTAREYCPIYAKDAIEKAYKAYHDLGGNGTITELYNKLMALPTEPKEQSSLREQM